MATAAAPAELSPPTSPRPRPRLIGRTRRRVFRFCKAIVWNQLDVLIIGNLVLLGVELENAAVYQDWRVVFCSLYIVEMLFRFCYRGRWHFLHHFGHALELCIVAAACVCVFFLGGEPGWLWRLTVFRVVRLARIEKFAQSTLGMKDLWLIIQGFRRGSWSLGWFAIVFTFILFSCAGAVVGLVGPVPDEDSAYACSAEARDRGECIDVKELFGSVPRAMLTLLQLSTRDGWASVVRGLSSRRPLASLFLTGFVSVTAYGLASVFIGVLVRSTLQLARTHSMHGTQKGINEDAKTVAYLKAFFDDALHTEERCSVRVGDVRDWMGIPAVGRAMAGLELPFKNEVDLWSHLDRHRKGELTTTELCDGIQLLRKPSNANDMTALAARMGGSVTYVKRMGFRAERLLDNLHDLRHVLGASFEELAKLAEPNGDSLAEVALRAQGIIQNSAPPVPPRYTM